MLSETLTSSMSTSTSRVQIQGIATKVVIITMYQKSCCLMRWTPLRFQVCVVESHRSPRMTKVQVTTRPSHPNAR